MKKLFRFIGMIFKGLWKVISFIRITLVNLIFLFSIGLIYFLYIHAEAPAPSLQSKEAALVLDLSGPIVEETSYINPMDSVTGSLFGQEMPRENVLFDVVDTIRHAKTDKRISGLVLSLREMSETNLTKLRYIAKAINEFKASGKPVYAVSDFYNQSQYYLASYADKIFMAPDGGVLMRGYSSYTLYYKTLLDKLDVSTHVFRVGTYKSAIEPFIRDDMSDAARESATRWLNQLWEAYVDDIAANRHIDPAQLNPSSDQLLQWMKESGGDMAALSLKLGLVDELTTRQQTRDELVKAFGSDGDDSFNSVSYYDYKSTVPNLYDPAQNDIAVVVASGTIMDGKQSRGTVGGDTTADLLRQALKDDKVKAVVLRVDSPGGSSFASEVIRNEVDALRAAGKPVVVSMSSLAASGGYWISMSADKIVAQPTTLTGSIGVFSVLTTFEKGLNKLGVHADGVGTSPFSGVGVTTGLNSAASQIMQLGVEHAYQRFITLVSQSRGIPMKQVDGIAQGHVWTGQDALEYGLVDHMGDFDDAVQAAAKLASLEKYNLYWVQEPMSPFQQFLQDVTGQVRAQFGFDASSLLPAALQPMSRQVMADAGLLDQLNDPKGQYAFCLTCQVE